MNISPESYAEICKQEAFISALIAGFSFAFIGVLLVSAINKRVVDWILGISVTSISGLLLCAMMWTLSAARMAYYIGTGVKELSVKFITLHKTLSVVFSLSFFLFLITLGLCGWIRSKRLGIVSAVISLISIIYFIITMRNFVL